MSINDSILLDPKAFFSKFFSLDWRLPEFGTVSTNYTSLASESKSIGRPGGWGRGSGNQSVHIIVTLSYEMDLCPRDDRWHA